MTCAGRKSDGPEMRVQSIRGAILGRQTCVRRKHEQVIRAAATPSKRRETIKGPAQSATTTFTPIVPATSTVEGATAGRHASRVTGGQQLKTNGQRRVRAIARLTKEAAATLK